MSSELLFSPSGSVQRQSAQAGALPEQLYFRSAGTPLTSWLRYLVSLVLLMMSLTSFAFQDPTQVPAIQSERAVHSPLTAVTKAGERLIAVGQRGHILLSDDAGENWRQAQVSVSSDLVAVSFASDTHGWAVGHSGVVLHTRDGGESWVLQLDGEQTSTLIQEYYQARIEDEAYPDAEMLLERERVLISFGGTQPLMDVYFADENNGYVVGIFNRLLRTTDGGVTWEPWSHRVDNPYELHFYSISVGGDGLYLTGEQGMVWRFDEQQEYFNSVPTPYSGTLFGVAVGGDQVVAFGMRGNAFLSADQGESWTQLEIDSMAGLTDGVVVDRDTIVLVSLAGELLISTDRGRSFEAQPVSKSMPFYGLAQVSGSQLALVGAEGVRQLAVTTSAATGSESSVSLFSADSIAANSLEHRHVKQ